MYELVTVEEVATGKRHDLPADAITGTTPLVTPSHHAGTLLPLSGRGGDEVFYVYAEKWNDLHMKALRVAKPAR